MKLQPWLALVKSKQLSGIITKGGPYSNHVHATAYACFLNNLSCTIIIKARQGMLTPTLNDVANWNAKVIYAPTDYNDEEKWGRVATDEHKLLVPMGGEGPVAVNGVTDFLRTLELPFYDHIICPVGTGTTLSGIAKTGKSKKNIIGINPGIDDDYSPLLKEIKLDGTATTIRIVKFPELEKFGKWPTFLPPLMNEWFSLWQLPTDIIYTAKMFYGFFKLIGLQSFASDDSVLLVHTGGLQGNRSLPPGTLNF